MECKKDIKKEEVKKEVIGVSSSGSPFYTPIEYYYDESIKCMVPKFGKPLNRYEMIQACKPSCDINYIVSRALAGDQSVLNVCQGDYADITDIPDNLNDLQAMQKDAISSFDNLDPKIKVLFNNDVDLFINALNNGTYQEIIAKALNLENKKEVKKEEVKKEEVKKEEGK